MSHRKTKKGQRKNPRSEQTICRRCGSTDILYGKKRGLCKKCRSHVRKPKGGWHNADGEKVTITILRCNNCEDLKGEKKLFSRKRNGNLALPDTCPKCGGTDVEEMEQW